MITRRPLIGTFLAAPIIIRTPGLLMPIKPLKLDLKQPYWAIIHGMSNDCFVDNFGILAHSYPHEIARGYPRN